MPTSRSMMGSTHSGRIDPAANAKDPSAATAAACPVAYMVAKLTARQLGDVRTEEPRGPVDPAVTVPVMSAMAARWSQSMPWRRPRARAVPSRPSDEADVASAGIVTRSPVAVPYVGEMVRAARARIGVQAPPQVMPRPKRRIRMNATQRSIGIVDGHRPRCPHGARSRQSATHRQWSATTLQPDSLLHPRPPSLAPHRVRRPGG